MKKVVIVISVILSMGVIFMAGLWFGMNRNDETLDDTPTIESGDISGDEILNPKDEVLKDETPTEEELMEKYKLSDKYTLEWAYEDNQDEEIWNLINQEGLVADSLEFESDGITHKIELTNKEKDEFNPKYNRYEVKLNGKTPNKDEVKVAMESCYLWAIVDLDPSDMYKELVVEFYGGIDAYCYVNIYRVTKDGLEEIDSHECVEIRKLNNKYILPEYNYNVEERLVEGYYMYEDGEFKFIDRFLTGEKITDEEENYTENFRNQIFTVPGDDSSIELYAKYQGDIVRVRGKIKLLKKVFYEDVELYRNVYYNCEAVEDVYIIKNGERIQIPAGTILE